MNSKFLDYDLNQLRHFYAIAYFGGFSRAARATGLSQPALSSGLKKIEHELGTQLIQRTSTEFKLTPAGASLFEFCQETRGRWGDLQASIGEQANQIPQRIRMGTAISIGYSPLIRLISRMTRSQRPVEAELHMSDSHQIMRDLQEGKLDLAFLPDDVQANDLHFEPTVKEPVILVASKKAKVQVKGEKWREALGLQLLVNYPRDTPMRSIVDRVLIRERVRFHSEISVSGIEAIKLFVARGVGLGFVLKPLVQEEIQNGLLKEVRLPVTLPKRGITVACRANDRSQLRPILEQAVKSDFD